MKNNKIISLEFLILFPPPPYSKTCCNKDYHKNPLHFPRQGGIGQGDRTRNSSDYYWQCVDHFKASADTEEAAQNIKFCIDEEHQLFPDKNSSEQVLH